MSRVDAILVQCVCERECVRTIAILIEKGGVVHVNTRGSGTDVIHMYMYIQPDAFPVEKFARLVSAQI